MIYLYVIMLKAFEKQVASILYELEKENIISTPNEEEDYMHMANLVRERIGNFNEWKSSKRHLRGVGGVVDGIEICMEEDIPHGTMLKGPFRLVSSPVDAARRLREQFGNIASHNSYKIIQAAIAKSGINHTNAVRATIMEHFPADENVDVLESNLFHIDLWTPVE